MTKTKALYLSTMWPPYGQGGEELTNHENYDILKDIFDFQILTTSPETSPTFSKDGRHEPDSSNIHRLLKSGQPADAEYNLQVFHALKKEHRPEVLFIGHPFGFGPALVDELRRTDETKIFFLGDITVYQDNVCGIFPSDYFRNDYCIFVSDFTRHCLETGWHSFLPKTRQFEFNKNKCYTLYPSIETQTEYSDISEFSVCSLGRFDRVKGFDVLINSALKYNYIKYLTIYGDGNYYSRFSKHAHCPGWLHPENKQDALRKHSVFVFSSNFHETFGRTWLEAASVGLPLVISDLDVMQEIIPAGQAIMFKSGDIDDLARAIHELKEKPARQEYQQKSLELASKYSHALKHNHLLEITQQILGQMESAAALSTTETQPPL